MKTKYLCPHCEEALNVDNDIVLKAKNNSGRKGIVFLHTLLGNYNSRFSAEFTITEGEKVKFYCPLCNSNLTNLKNERLAYFTMIDGDDKKFTVVFSKIYGEKCTYVIQETEVIKSYGDQLNIYTNPDWFLMK